MYVGGVGASIWERALHFFHFFPTPHQGTCQPPKSACDTGKVPQGGLWSDARSLPWGKLSQDPLRDSRPADSIERRPHSAGSADPHVGVGERARGLGLCPPLTCPHAPATACGRFGKRSGCGSRALHAQGKPQGCSAATVPRLGNESPPGGGSRPPTMASLSFLHSPLYPLCCPPPLLNPALKTEAVWMGASILALTTPPCKPSCMAPRPNQESWAKLHRALFLPPKTTARMLRGAPSPEPDLLGNRANYKEEKEHLLNISNVPR